MNLYADSAPSKVDTVPAVLVSDWSGTVVSARTLEAPALTSTPSALRIVPIIKVSGLPRIVNRSSGARRGIEGKVMLKESSFAADQPTIHLLFGSSAIKEINAYVPKKATMAIVGILIIGLSRRPFNRL